MQPPPSTKSGSYKFILATDLDGTFLDGDDTKRYQLYELFRRRHDELGLIFVTGRGLESVLPILNDPLVPSPQYIIADVGSTVVKGDDLEPVRPLQNEITSRWPGTQKIREALGEFEFLEAQEVPQERRQSYYLEDTSDLPQQFFEKVESLGCQTLYSKNKYLDILPAGVSKGRTLQKLVHTLKLDKDSTVVAGDTLNDLSMFETGLMGVSVGNAEEQLQEEIKSHPNTYQAEAEGAGGILEGLCHHELIDQSDVPDATPTYLKKTGNSRHLVVYHRPPFEEVETEGKTTYSHPKSPNGIIPTLLNSLSDKENSSWVSWHLQKTRTPQAYQHKITPDVPDFENIAHYRIPFTKKDVDLFYKRFCKDALWPIIFSFPSKAKFDADLWVHFQEVNQSFAKHVAKEADKDAVVAIHDYNLWLVPAFLRRFRPDLRIGFFHHTAFPSSDIFSIIPWHHEIVNSLLQCDYVGFHIPQYVENFVQAVRSCSPIKVVESMACAPKFVTYGCALGVDNVSTQIETDERKITLGAHPVGIAVDKVAEIVKRTETQQQIEKLRHTYNGARSILSIERLDYVKGTLEKVLAFENLLECDDSLHEKVVFTNIVTPPSEGMIAYKAIREKLDQAVGRVNGRFGKAGWVPIHYFYRSLPFEEVIAYYAASDIAWITPLRDGLNLIAKEYVAAKYHQDTDGLLLLSEFAGAAVELHGALLTNPYDLHSLTHDLKAAIQITPLERKQRIKRLYNIIATNDLHAWNQTVHRSIAESLNH